MSFWSNFIHKKSSFNPFVVGITLLVTLLLVILTIALPEQMQAGLNWAKSAIFANFSWFYVLAFSIFLCFLLLLALSSVGNIKLGSNEEQPEFPFMSWLAMLFAAGMGVGLMFFGVAEPLTHYASPIIEGTAQEKQQSALLHTVFHWGVHAWSVYGVIALALAYFAFRYKLPLALRSCFYPLLKDKVNGKAGDMIDIFALIATLFGIVTTLGFGSSQLSAGLQQLGWIEQSSFGVQVAIIIVVMSIAVASTITGVGKGVKMLSELNMILAVLLLLFVLVTGPTIYLLSTFSDNLGTYLSQIIRLSFKTYAYDSEHTAWFTGWTVLYWAWWCSWAPFVGLFIARISRGRTIREFVFGVLVIPSLFGMLWFTVFGNSAIWLDTHVAHGALQQLTSAPEKLLFTFLEYLPLSTLTSVMALVVIALFFITSADSGIYVLNNMASRDKSLASPKWQMVMWGVLMMLLAISLMSAGGLGALQTMTLVVALPFAMLMLLMCWSLWKGLIADRKYFTTQVTPSSIFWTGEKWKYRLGQMLNPTQQQDVAVFLQDTALPAMNELKDELCRTYQLKVEIIERDDEQPAVELVIYKEEMQNFMYGIRAVQKSVSDEQAETYQLLSYFFDGRAGYDVQYMTHNELIADILKQYERYLSLLSNVGRELMAHERSELAE